MNKELSKDLKPTAALVSIIIPVFNREHIVRSTLDSILKQSYENWECLLVDDGSTDATHSTIESYCNQDRRFKFFARPEQVIKGANSCRNYGYQKAQGAFINWFDSDDIMETDFLKKKVAAFQESTDAVVHRNRYASYDLTEFRESKFDYNNGQSIYYNYAMEHIEIQTCGLMWRSDFLKNKSLFDTDFERYQDNEFHIRMLAYHPELYFIDENLAIIRSGDGHESQISSQQTKSKKKLYDIFIYRYRCLFHASKEKDGLNDTFYKTISKKALWAFYAGLQFEKDRHQRKKDYFSFREELGYIYAQESLSALDVFKSRLFILKTILFK